MTGKSNIYFSKKNRDLILEAFGKGINEDGYLYELESKELLLTPDNEEILCSKFGGIKRGSEIFLKNDLSTIVKLVEGNI